MKTLFRSAAVVLLTNAALGQHSAPPVDMRHAEVRRDAIVGATIIVRPGEAIEDGVILLRDGVIESVGAGLDVPAGYRQHLRHGLVVYPGLIDPAIAVDSKTARSAASAGVGAHWNLNITPQLAMSAQPVVAAATRDKLRRLGFTVVQLLPDKGILRGSGTVVLLAGDDERPHPRPLAGTSMMAASLESGGWGGGYPGSRMGAIALARQTLQEARWHRRATAIYEEDPTNLEPPEQSDALDALAPLLAGEQRVLFDADTELKAIRAARIAEEFDLNAAILGSGFEFRRLDEIAAMNLPIVVPLSFPETPKASDPWAADSISLRDLLSWKHAPENPRRLLDSAVSVSLTTHRLKDVSAFPKQVRRALDAGLPHDEMLACLTTRPARLLGLEEVIGTVEAGRLGNLVVVDGELFTEGAEVREVWVAGRRHEIKPATSFPFDGAFSLYLGEAQDPIASAVLDPSKKSIAFELPGDEEPVAIAARTVRIEPRRVSFVCDGAVFGVEGIVRASAVVVGKRLIGAADTDGGQSISFEFRASPDIEDEPEAAPETEPGVEEVEEEEEEEEEPIPTIEPLPLPLGAYGRLEPPRGSEVVFRNATIWTCAEEGILAKADLLVKDGRIAAIGVDLPVSEGIQSIDLAGRHLTPGLIDCHSHTAIKGGVNEGGQNNTAECRIGDVLDPDDINLYRQLAGGLTSANLLHGSANPIGGQNAVIKLRWGGTVEDLRFVGAKPGVKFALGENVKRGGSYPNTRMGIAAFIEDAFRAADERRAAQHRFDSSPPGVQARTLPPRPDLELDAIDEILTGERLIHCHSYRQDEILMLLRLCERYGVQIGTLQHVLEGYKVADAIASHGAGASSFSDWWAYKMEVMDAIPYNGALMDGRGVVVSFNSDSDEVARRMNDEGAKAMRWGGLSEEAALAFVTINPARQLRIDDRVGSLEVGKDADLAIWNANPLSSFALCDETWIDGARYFSRDDAFEAHRQNDATRSQLLAQTIEDKKKKPKGDDEEPTEEPTEDLAKEKPTRLLARLLLEREEWLLERVHRGHDPTAAEPAACGCGAGSLVELARSLARDKAVSR